MAYTKPGSPFLFDETTNDIVGFKDRDTSEVLLSSVSGGAAIDGESVLTQTMSGTTAWISAIPTTLIALSSRICRLQAWTRVLTRDESRADFYGWSGPAAQVRYLCNEAIGSTVTDSIAGAVATLSGLTWTDSVPDLPVRSKSKDGYSLNCTSLGTGAAAGATVATAVIPAAAMASLVGTKGLTLAHWINFRGVQTSSFRSMVMLYGSGAAGPSIRWDCTSVAGQILVTLNGIMGAATGVATALPSANIAGRLIGKWVHVAIAVDYLANTVTLYLNGGWCAWSAQAARQWTHEQSKPIRPERAGRRAGGTRTARRSRLRAAHRRLEVAALEQARAPHRLGAA